MYPTLPFNFPLNNTSNLPMYLSNQKPAMPFNPQFIQNFPIQPIQQQQQQPRNLPLQNQMSILYSQLLQQQRLAAAANSNPMTQKFSPMVLKTQAPEPSSFEAQMVMARRMGVKEEPIMNVKQENFNVKKEAVYVKKEAFNVKEEETDDTDTSEKSPSGSKLLSASKKIAKATPAPVKKAKKAKTQEEGKKTRMSWSPNEDALLLSSIEKYGKRWAQIAYLMGGRTGKQVRDRYLNVLVPNINRGKWTDEEDSQMWVLYKEIGPQWCKIAARMEGRTEAQVKNRFYTYLKKHFEGK